MNPIKYLVSKEIRWGDAFLFSFPISAVVTLIICSLFSIGENIGVVMFFFLAPILAEIYYRIGQAYINRACESLERGDKLSNEDMRMLVGAKTANRDSVTFNSYHKAFKKNFIRK